MKNYNYILLFFQLLILVSCRSIGQVHTDPSEQKIYGKVVHIDSTRSWYIINFMYEKNRKGVFISNRNNCKYPKNSLLIKNYRTYYFKLARMIQNNYKEKEVVFEVEGKVTWNSSSGVDYFEYSSNTCDLYTWQ